MKGVLAGKSHELNITHSSMAHLAVKFLLCTMIAHLFKVRFMQAFKRIHLLPWSLDKAGSSFFILRIPALYQYIGCKIHEVQYNLEWSNERNSVESSKHGWEERVVHPIWFLLTLLSTVREEGHNHIDRVACSHNNHDDVKTSSQNIRVHFAQPHN